jgi:hypothetical protein
MLGNEDNASVYSHSPDCPKPGLPSQVLTMPPLASFNLLDISLLNY